MPDKDKNRILGTITGFMGHDGPLSKMPPKMQPTRWNSVGDCADNWLEDEKEVTADGTPAFPGVFRNCESLANTPVEKTGWTFLATRCLDPRIRAGIIFESEHNAYWQVLNAWNRSKSDQGFGVGFRAMDIVDRVYTHDRPRWEKALADPSAVYPRTVKAIGEISNATLIPNPGAVAVEYLGFFEKGVKAGNAEFEKLYAYLEEPEYLHLHLFAPGRSGSAMRAIAQALAPKIGAFASFMLPFPGRADDSWFTEKLQSEAAKEELYKNWCNFGLDNPDLVPELQQFALNVEGERDKDRLTRGFARGDSSTVLFEHMSRTVAVVLTTCVIAELCFSQMKHTMNLNETELALDHELKYIFNALLAERQERRNLISDYKSGGSRTLHTQEQIILGCNQALTKASSYSWDKMGETPGRRALSGHLTEHTEEHTAKAVAAKKKKYAEKRGGGRTEASWAKRDLEAASEKHSIEIDAAKLSLVADPQRRFAVAMEKKFTGQVGRGMAVWTKLAGGLSGLLAEVKLTVPILYPFLSSRPNLLMDNKKWSVPRPAASRRQLQLSSNEGDAWVTLKGDTHPGYEWVDMPLLTYSAGSMVGGYYSSPTTLGCSSKSGRAPAPNTPGAPSTLRSLLQAFFVGSNGTIVTGANELRRGEPCPHCSVELEVNKKKVRVPSEHWGGVACFLDNKDRKVLGRLVFMATSDATELHRPKAQFVGRAMTERKGAGVV